MKTLSQYILLYRKRMHAWMKEWVKELSGHKAWIVFAAQKPDVVVFSHMQNLILVAGAWDTDFMLRCFWSFSLFSSCSCHCFFFISSLQYLLMHCSALVSCSFLPQQRRVKAVKQWKIAVINNSCIFVVDLFCFLTMMKHCLYRTQKSAHIRNNFFF